MMRAMRLHVGDDGRDSLRRLLVCLATALLLCFAHVAGSRIMVGICLILFLIVVAQASFIGKTFDVFLFFLPWSPLLKQQVGDISFYTIALGLACAAALARRRFLVKPYQILLPAILLIVTLAAKLVQGHSVDRGYLLFMAMLVIFPSLVSDGVPCRASFEQTCLFFAAGIISAALSAQLVAGHPNIAAFINVASWAHVTRLSGYYGDANFYSSQINACIAGLLLILAKESSYLMRGVFIGLLIALLYCGLLSASKSFVIVGACELCIWIAVLFGRGARKASNLVLLIAAAAAILFFLSTVAFQHLLSILDSRFSYAASLSQVTTGRSDVWRDYLDLFTRDPKLLLLGEGYTDITLQVLRGKASHNTIIQCIFQFGIIGFPVLASWFACLVKDMLPVSLTGIGNAAKALMLVGTFLPWLGLDYLFFDEFFLLPVFVGWGIGCLSDSRPDSSLQKGQA